MTEKTWKVPLTETTLDEAEVTAAAAVVRNKWLTMGAEVAAFEREFAGALGAKHALAVANGTVALHLAYEMAGLRAGDEFCLPALTFVATLHAGLYLGGKPVLIDCASSDDLTLCPADLERKITPRTRLIITMPYGGFLPDMPRIMALAKSRGIPVIEDACHAPLADLDGRKAGTFGLAGTFSFYGNKNLTTGEGGMIVTDDDGVAAKIRLLRSHGMTTLTWERHQKNRSDMYDVRAVGYNYRLDEIRGAIGRQQLRKLPAGNAKRSEAARLLRAALEPARRLGLHVPFLSPRGNPAFHLFPVLVPARVDRGAFRQFLADQGVQTSVHYPPMTRFPHLQELLAGSRTPVLDAMVDRIVTIPVGPTLQPEQIEYVAGVIGQALASL